MASASATVDSKAELTTLLEQWEREQQSSTEELVNILTKSVDLLLVYVMHLGAEKEALSGLKVFNYNFQNL